MIVGSGDIASVLPKRSDLLFFASGVSNSGETQEAAYQREKDVLYAQPLSSHLVYFSSLGVFTADSRYFDHKREMEFLVKEMFLVYTIVRIGNIDWGNNPHTLINYLRANPVAEIQDAWRYIIDKDEFLYWIDKIPEWSCEMNIPGRRMKVQEVYDEYVTETR